MDKFVKMGESKVKIMNPKSYERQLKEEKEEREYRILERKVAKRKKNLIRVAALTGAAMVALGIAVRVDYYNWKVDKYKQAGYKEMLDYSTQSVNWVGEGLSDEEISFGTYVSERCESIGIGKGK